MKYTTNYNLKKPEGSDTVNIDDINSNMDALDGQLKTVSDSIPSVPVQSVNNKTGSVTLAAGDVGAEPSITGTGNTTDFWSGAKTFRDLATDVRNVILTGLSIATNTAISAADSILSALGKLQSQITSHMADTAAHGIGTAALATTAQTIRGAINEVNTNTNTHISDNVKHITSTERTTWNGKYGYVRNLATTDDLNAITQSGFYNGANTAVNAPFTGAPYFMLEVINDGDVSQRLITKLTSGQPGGTIYTRVNAGGSWSTLVKILSQTDYNTLMQSVSGGKKIQSGTVSSSSSSGNSVSTTVTFPTAFGSSPLVILTPNGTTLGTNSGTAMPWSISGVGTTSFTFSSNQAGTISYNWVAIGN